MCKSQHLTMTLYGSKLIVEQNLINYSFVDGEICIIEKHCPRSSVSTSAIESVSCITIGLRNSNSLTLRARVRTSELKHRIVRRESEV
jgi:hypothetical protein